MTQHVTLSSPVEQRDRQCLLHVGGSGPGIAPELQERVFEPCLTTKARGGGLGLPSRGAQRSGQPAD